MFLFLVKSVQCSALLCMLYCSAYCRRIFTKGQQVRETKRDKLKTCISF